MAAWNDVFGIFTASPGSGPGLRRSNTTRSDRGFTVRDVSPHRGRSYGCGGYDSSRSRRPSTSSYSHRSSSTHSDRYNVRYASPTRGRPPHRDPYNPFTPKPYGFGFGERPESARTVSPLRRERRSSSTYSRGDSFTSNAFDPYNPEPTSGYHHDQGDISSRREHRSTSAHTRSFSPRSSRGLSSSTASEYNVRDVSPTRARHRSRRDSYHSDDGCGSTFDPYGPFAAKYGFLSSPSPNLHSSSGSYAGTAKYGYESDRPRRKPTRLTVEELPDYVRADRGSQKLYEYAGTEDPDGEQLSDGSSGRSRPDDGYSSDGGHRGGRAF